MLKYFISAMVLVLGLFTVTALSALTFKSAKTFSYQSTEYHYSHSEEAEDGWNDPDNWEPGAASGGCGSNEVTLCQVDIAPFSTINEYLLDLQQNQGVNSYELFSGRTEVQMGEKP